MEQTIGKALRAARLKKGLTLDEVAKATRVRSDWLGDLEDENYLRFPSLAYARSFQILYAKHLGVDLTNAHFVESGKMVLSTSFDHAFEDSTPVGYRGIRRRQPIRRSRWIFVFSLFTFACAVGAITALFILDVLRLPSWDELTGDAKPTGTELREPIPAASPELLPTPEPTATPPSGPVSEDETLHIPLPAPEPLTILDSLRNGTVAQMAKAFAKAQEAEEEEFSVVPRPPAPDRSGQTIEEGAEGEGSSIPLSALPGISPFIMEADAEALATPFPVDVVDVEADIELLSTPTPTPSATPEEEESEAAATSLPPAREIQIASTRRVRLKVFINDPNTLPIHDLWLEPSSPLTVEGDRIWIESPNRRSLKVTSGGAPVRLPAGASRGKIEIQ